MGEVYALIWRDDYGRDREYRLQGPVVAGRRRGDSTYEVVLTPDGAGEPVATGIHDSTVSRVHARLEPTGEGLLVWDVGTRGKGSTNGTFVSEQRVEPGKPFLAKPGDTIRMGLYTIMEVARVSRNKAVRVVAAGTTIILQRREAERIPLEARESVTSLDEDRVAVTLASREDSRSTVDLGERGVKIVAAPEAVRVRQELNIILFELTEALRVLEGDPQRGLRKAALKVRALSRVPAYRRLIEERLRAGDILEEAITIARAVDLGRAPQGAAERLRSRLEELRDVAEMSLRAPEALGL